jgi:RNA polymerase sigma factor (sigma-70 family)
MESFSELVESYWLVRPVEAGAWLFRVAKNRITDLFRKTKTEAHGARAPNPDQEGEFGDLEELLPSAEMGGAAYAGSLLLDELEAALEELPPAQRDAFVAHALEGRSFKELASETGVSVNTLLSRQALRRSVLAATAATDLRRILGMNRILNNRQSTIVGLLPLRQVHPRLQFWGDQDLRYSLVHVPKDAPFPRGLYMAILDDRSFCCTRFRTEAV